MALEKVLITGSCGLVGSESVRCFTDMGMHVTGIDNDRRGDWFGKEGSTISILSELKQIPIYRHHSINIINKMVVGQIVSLCKPDLIIHCAAQPSHDKSAEIPFEDFMTNAVGTINLLEAAREHCPESPFIFLSTNKVYGDGPNKIILRETPSRYDFADILGVNESMSIDQTLHSPFGASKASADLMVQEYGKYYDMPTVCFRCGCLTGVGQQGVELHGFLNYLCKTAKAGKEYTVYGHGGKQVRDMLHVSDLVNAFHEFAKCPSNGEVYNMGGGYANSISILEAIQQIKNIKGLEVKTKEGPARKGDHVCYYSNLDKFRHHYPSWNINKQIKDILEEMLA